MLKATGRDTVGRVVAFPNLANSQWHEAAKEARRLELEAENAKLKDAAIALMLEIRDLRGSPV
jgi:hypothetical protein